MVKKSNLSSDLFLWFRIKYPRNRECFDQSCVNQTESVHGTWHFLFLSHLLYGKCVKIFSKNWYTFQRATQRPRIQLTDNRAGAAVISAAISR